MNDRWDIVRLIFMTPGGVATTFFMVFCALFTIASVDLQASNSPQRGLEWLLGVESDVITFSGESTVVSATKSSKGSHDAWKAKRISDEFRKAPKKLNPPPQFSNNVGTVKSPKHIELTETVRPAPTLQISKSSVEWKYEICLLVAIGSRVRKDRPYLPYSELYRLFNAVKGAADDSDRKKAVKGTQILVGTDSSTILCKMVRDALGQSVVCSNFTEREHRNNKCKHIVVGDTKTYTPQPTFDELQKSGMLWDTTEIVDLDLEDPTREPPYLPERQWRPTIVTAFSSNHVEIGLLLLRSLGRVAIEQNEYNISVVVWTMNDFPQLARNALVCVVEELETLYKVQTEVRPFDFNSWPTWMHINQKRGYKGGRGEYAWKAIMVHTVLLERGFVYWADAGDRFRNPQSLTQTLKHVKSKGFASRKSSGRVKDWCHVKQLQYLGANIPAFLNLPNCDASGIGFTLRRYKELARPWYECSITRQCIAPDGSSRKNHRQDQSALTLLATLSGNRCEGVDPGILKQTDGKSGKYWIGVNATKCYRDPLNVKWR